MRRGRVRERGEAGRVRVKGRGKVAVEERDEAGRVRERDEGTRRGRRGMS